MRKIWKALTSMKCAVILLVLLAALCALSSAIPQGQTYAYYANAYSERTAGLILWLRLDDAYHSWWFIALSAFLCLNLIFCNLVRLPELIRRTKRFGTEESVKETAAGFTETVGAPDTESAAGQESAPDTEKAVSGIRGLFEALHFNNVSEGTTESGGRLLYAAKNKAGLWGAWICHLGILLLILGFGLGQFLQQEYAVYGVPGQTRMVGDTGLALTIDDFRVLLRDDDTVDQYEADITVRDMNRADGSSESATISVNHPASLFHMDFIQNSTGWAAKVSVLKDGKPLQEEVLCAGESLAVKDKPELVIFLTAFYPDFVMDGGRPKTATGKLNNPGYLYTVYYQNEILGMNVLLAGEELTIDEYTVLFSDPQNYTLIQVKKDAFGGLALFGGILVMLGLLLSFYLQPVTLSAEEKEDGSFEIRANSRKGGALYYDRVKKAIMPLSGAGQKEKEN